MDVQKYTKYLGYFNTLFTLSGSLQHCGTMGMEGMASCPLLSWISMVFSSIAVVVFGPQASGGGVVVGGVVGMSVVVVSGVVVGAGMVRMEVTDS